jgi:hypothetical protein
VRYQTALHSDTENSREAGLIAVRGERRKGRIEPFSQIYDPSQNGVASRVLADYVHATPIGASPSGKAAVFGTAIPRFESWRPSHHHLRRKRLAFQVAGRRGRSLGSPECGTSGSTGLSDPVSNLRSSPELHKRNLQFFYDSGVAGAPRSTAPWTSIIMPSTATSPAEARGKRRSRASGKLIRLEA